MWIRIALFCLLASFAAAQVTTEQLDAQARAYFDRGAFNGAVLVARDGKLLLSKGYGMANFEWNIPNAPGTKFRLGSITKQFTAMAILLLEQQGKLKTDDPVCKHVERCPAAWAPITLHHLLTHTSGIPNFTAFPDYTLTMSAYSPAAETVRRFKDKPLDFPPGTKWAYSNSGYVLLGDVLERASGMKYADFVKRFIFDPLEMKDTGYDSNAQVLPERASGYEKRGGTLLNASYIDMSVPHAAGALYSTTLDLMKWDEALKSRKLLTPEDYKRYFTPFLGNYAYGWMVRNADGAEIYSHGGGINGFASMILRVPARNLLVVALANVLPSEGSKLAQTLLDLALGKEAPKPATGR